AFRREYSTLENRRLYARRGLFGFSRNRHRRAFKLCPARAWTGLRTRRHCCRRYRRYFSQRWRGFNSRYCYRRVHHQRVDEWTANSIGSTGVADGGYWRDHHHCGISRYDPPSQQLALVRCSLTELNDLGGSNDSILNYKEYIHEDEVPSTV